MTKSSLARSCRREGKKYIIARPLAVLALGKRIVAIARQLLKLWPRARGTYTQERRSI